MITKRFLVPILAFAALVLPAEASVSVYCDTFCGANTMAAFNTLTGGVGSATQSTFTAGNISTAGSGLSQYLDSTTGLLFFDDNFQTLQLIGNALEVGASFSSGLVTVPTGVTAFSVALSAAGSFPTYTIAGTSYLLSATAIQFGFVDGSGNIGNILINHSSGGPLVFDSFNVSGGTSNSDTPEVGTLLLIGFGLIAMRWMNRLPRLIFRTPRIV